MGNEWEQLNNPPVVIALFQIVYDKVNTKLNDFIVYDEKIKRLFPKRAENIGISLTVSGTPMIGKSKVVGEREMRIADYIYSTEDQKKKLLIQDEKITFQDESKYKGWDSFKSQILEILQTIEQPLKNKIIRRISIRFINRFSIDDFTDPTEYFRTVISTTAEDSTNALSFPLTQYGFRLNVEVPDSTIYAIINQNLECKDVDGRKYFFDIDVLDRKDIIFDIQIIMSILDELRTVKNDIFFNNLTEKTLKLCN